MTAVGMQIPITITIAILASAAHSAEWSQEDLDKAVAAVAAYEVDLAECVKDAGTSIRYEISPMDLNSDGVNELAVTSSIADLGGLATECYGRDGHSTHLLISDGLGGWKRFFGYEGLDLKYHGRKSGIFPDVELDGPGSCSNIWRFHDAEYGPWKVCDHNGSEIYADIAPWIEGNGVSRDAGEDLGPVTQPDLGEIKYRAPEFDHNGSLMRVDHRNGRITYLQPKRGIRRAIKAGTVLFESEPWDQYDINRSIRGTAYVFKTGCKPAAYQVSGGFYMSWHTLVLRGPAPVRKKNSCEIEQLSWDSPNAELRFESLVD
ncbi:hypothetical protein [Pseudorhizobium flavum]|uniref:hypothetical protein n=1 Tax=Pseudorhizobium flavum TaxID=1335061 RepID=UPI00377053EF